MLAVAGLVFAAAMFVTLRPRGDGVSPRGAQRGRAASQRRWFGGGGDELGSREVDSASEKVNGRVVDPEGVPVEGGALILSCLEGDDVGRLLSKPLRVGEDGWFSGHVCPGETCAQFQHPHMIQDEVWILRPGSEVELVARLLGRVEGQVVDSDGDPIAGAQLMVLPPPDEDDPYGVSPFVSRHASSDAEGYFYFSKIERPPCDPCAEAAGRCDPELPAGLPTRSEMLLTARAPRFRMAERRIDAEDPDMVVVRLEPPAVPVAGRLLDPEGVPYARARVLASDEVRPYDREVARVGEDGTFVLDELGDGPYLLRALQDGLELARVEGLTPAEAPAELALTGEGVGDGPDVELTVVDAGGRPVTGATVSGGPFSSARTDEAGRVRARRVVPGPYRVQVRSGHGPGRRRSFEVPPAREVVRVSLEL